MDKQNRAARDQFQALPVNVISTSEDSLGNVMSALSYYIALYEQHIEVTNDTTDDYTFFLPSPAACAGLIFSISAILSTSGDVKLQDQDDSLDWTDLVLGDTLDFAVVMSNGHKWIVLASDID